MSCARSSATARRACRASNITSSPPRSTPSSPISKPFPRRPARRRPSKPARRATPTRTLENPMRRGVIVTTLTAVAAISMSVPAFADALLSGTIKSSDGKAMGGITGSAKPDGGTITTTVFTDTDGNFFFPALPNGSYRVWAQALSYQTAKGAVDLSANRKEDFTLTAMSDPESTFKQLPGNLMLDALPQRTPAEGRMKRIVRTVCTGCHTASFPLQHRFDE